VFAQYRIVSPYHCDTGIEVSQREERRRLRDINSNTRNRDREQNSIVESYQDRDKIDRKRH